MRASTSAYYSAVRTLGVALLALSSIACADHAPERPDSGPPRFVSARVQEEGLARCGLMLEGITSPEETPSFARLVRECSGMFRGRRCRDALSSATFSREEVETDCREDYCGDLRPAPSFCSIEMPTDREFLIQFGEFSRHVLTRDLARVMDEEGAREIARIFSQIAIGHAQ